MSQELTLAVVQDMYSELVGQVFRGKYAGDYDGSGKVWRKIDVEDNDPIIDKLRSIQSQVGGRIWKGFTGDGQGYDTFRFFVDLEDNSHGADVFEIVKAEPFGMPKPPATYPAKIGVAITLKGAVVVSGEYKYSVYSSYLVSINNPG